MKDPEYIQAKALRFAGQAAEELETIGRWATETAQSVRKRPASGYTVSGLSNALNKAGDLLAKAEALYALLEEDTPAPAKPSYTTETVWGDPLAGIPTVYTYRFSDGRTFIQEERKDIVTGGFSQKVKLREGSKETRSTLKELRAATAGANEDIEATRKAIADRINSKEESAS